MKKTRTKTKKKKTVMHQLPVHLWVDQAEFLLLIRQTLIRSHQLMQKLLIRSSQLHRCTHHTLTYASIPYFGVLSLGMDYAYSIFFLVISSLSSFSVSFVLFGKV